MAASPTLLFIVHRYDGDFPEAELPYLARMGWDIFLLPRLPYSIQNEELPANVRVSDVLLPGRWAKLPFLAHPGMLSLWEEEHRNFGQRQSRPRFLAFARAAAIALHTKHTLRRFILQKSLQQAPLVIYSYWYSEAVVGAGMLREIFPHLRVVCRAHGGDIYPCQSPNGYLPFRFTRHRFADRIFPCSDEGAAWLHSDGHPAEAVETARLGVSPAPGTAPASAHGRLCLVSCSNTDPVKRLPLLVDSLAALARSRPDLELVWHHLGGGPGLDALRAHAEQALSPLSNIAWQLHGQLARAELRAFLSFQPLDCLVNVSSSEGVPVSMMEALASGLPVVGTDVGGVREVVTPSTGILLPVDFNPEQFILAFDGINSWKMPEKRTANAKFVLRQYSEAANYARFAEQTLQRQFFLSENLLASGGR